MTAIRLLAENHHRLDLTGKHVLFHVPTSGLFELDEVGGAVLDTFQQMGETEPEDLYLALQDRFERVEVEETVEEFLSLDILGCPTEGADTKTLDIENYPLSTMALNVNTGCNLSCSYCYKEDIQAPSDGKKMEAETAFKSVELLLKQATERDRVNVVFFGGEPLTNMELIRAVVDYAEDAVEKVGKTVDFSLTTNATLLSDDLIDYFQSHRFGLTISMDGPKAMHDKNRLTVGGQGTYDVVSAKVKNLLARYEARPVGARVTLTAGVTDVEAIHHHLKYELGFFEVGFAPVTSDTGAFALNEAELAEAFAGMKRLGEDYVEGAIEGRNNGFSNMHQVVTDIVEGTRKVLPCGAGVGMLATDAEGDLHLCHRFVGSRQTTYGNVDSGIDGGNLSHFLKSTVERRSTDCGSCRIRNICAGGCYHESYARHGDASAATHHYCETLREWVDFGIEAYARIQNGNPGFFSRHIEPRRALS